MVAIITTALSTAKRQSSPRRPCGSRACRQRRGVEAEQQQGGGAFVEVRGTSCRAASRAPAGRLRARADWRSLAARGRTGRRSARTSARAPRQFSAGTVDVRAVWQAAPSTRRMASPRQSRMPPASAATTASANGAVHHLAAPCDDDRRGAHNSAIATPSSANAASTGSVSVRRQSQRHAGSRHGVSAAPGLPPASAPAPAGAPGPASASARRAPAWPWPCSRPCPDRASG